MMARQITQAQKAGKTFFNNLHLLCGPWMARQIAQAQKAKQFEQDGKTALLPYCG
jgi:hypothetical protein